MKYLKKFESSEDSFTQPSFLDPWYPHKIDTDINHSKGFPKKTNSDYDHTFYENKISHFALSAISGEEEIFDDVKDVFQDIIDEYNLLKVPTDTGRLPEGISYHNRFVPGWIDSNNNPHFCFYQIEIYVTGKDINSRREYLSTGSTMTHDLKDFYERVRQMGFKVVELSNNISLYSSGPLKIKIYK